MKNLSSFLYLPVLTMAIVIAFACQLQREDEGGSQSAQKKPAPKDPSDLESLPIADISLHGTNDRCTGILVEKNLVLTAAHCFFYNSFTNKNNPPKSVAVRKNNGEWSEPIDVDSSGESDIVTLEFKDIAWIKLKQNVEEVNIISIGIRAVENNPFNAGTIFKAYGNVTKTWFDRTVLALNLPVVAVANHNDLRKWEIPTAKNPTMERGDSGGPLVVKQDNKWLLIGVVQGFNHYGIGETIGFTAVQPFLPAIKTALGGKDLATEVIK